MAGKKQPVIDQTPEGEPEDIGKDTLFAGADDFEHEAPPTEDRGDDPDNPIEAAVDDDDDTELQADGADDKEAKQDEIAADAAEQGAEGGTEGAGDDADVVVAADADAEEDDEPDEDEISNYVSKDRFNAVNERMKLAEKNLANKEAEPEAEAEQVEAFDFDAKERKYMELVTEGDFDDAMVIRSEIRAAEKAENDATVASTNAQTQARFNEQIEFNQTVATLNEEFDQFNPNHKEYDQVLVDEVVDRRDLFVARGMSLSDSLSKAAKEVAKLYDVESNFERMADEEIARLAAEEATESGESPKPAAKKVDVAKKVALKDKQPPVMDEGSVIEEGEKSALTMDDAEFEALPEATKARMRGDIV